MRILSALGVVGVLSLMAASAVAAEPVAATGAGVFAGRNITFNGLTTITGLPVVADGNVVHTSSSLNVPSLYAGGTFTRTGTAFTNSTGDILFGGDIVDIGGPGSVLGGNVTSGGSISFLTPASTVVKGNVTAAANVSQPFSFATIQGNVLAGGDVNIQGTVQGGVTYGGALTQGTFSSIGGPIVHGGAVTPTPFVPLTLPAGRSLGAGGSGPTLVDFQNITLGPGTYGTLTYASGNTVTLTAGHYVFGNIVSTFSLNKLNFDTSGGPIDLYIAGDYDFNVVQQVNGVSLFAGNAPDPALAGNIFMEVLGNFQAHSSFYGTVFAPNGDIVLNNFVAATGRLWAGRDIVTNSATMTVPEPGSLAVLAGGVAMLVGRRRKV